MNVWTKVLAPSRNKLAWVRESELERSNIKRSLCVVFTTDCTRFSKGKDMDQVKSNHGVRDLNRWKFTTTQLINNCMCTTTLAPLQKLTNDRRKQKMNKTMLYDSHVTPRVQ